VHLRCWTTAATKARTSARLAPRGVAHGPGHRGKPQRTGGEHLLWHPQCRVDAYESGALALLGLRDQHVDRAGVRGAHAPQAKCGGSSEQAPGARVQQSRDISLLAGGSAGHGQENPGEQSLPRSSRPEPVLERSLRHPAGQNLAPADDVILRRQDGGQRRVVELAGTGHACSLAPAADILSSHPVAPCTRPAPAAPRKRARNVVGTW